MLTSGPARSGGNGGITRPAGTGQRLGSDVLRRNVGSAHVVVAGCLSHQLMVH